MNDPVRVQLSSLLSRNGYFRVPNEKRRAKEGQGYKKGYEVRFIAAGRKELLKIRSLLKKADLVPGNFFVKHSRFVQPVYGKESYMKIRSFLSARRM